MGYITELNGSELITVNKEYIAGYLKDIRKEINVAIKLIDDDGTKRILRDANGSLLELKRGLKHEHTN